ncbi:DUF3352 domain-containing protein [Patescibacteria group bacterium]|nr:DUF3352 domain-containing protein [Patescibacteria group bacterium]
MGKKSKAKKVIRELVKEKQKEEKDKSIRKKSKKELKKEAKKEAEKKKNTSKKHKPSKPKKEQSPKKRISKQTIFGSVLVLIMVTILSSVGYLLFVKALKASPIAKILPVETTVLSLEINTDPNHAQVIKSKKLMENHLEYSAEGLENFIFQNFGLEMENDLKNWLGRSVGLAYVKSSKENNAINKLYFAEITNKELAEDSLEGQINNYEGYEIYQGVKGNYATFINDFLLLSEKEQAIYEIIDAQKFDKLYSSSDYRRINNNMPLNKVAFAYMDFQKIDNSFLQLFPYLSEKGLSYEIIAPFTSIFKSEGVSLIAGEDKFIMQNFTNLNRNNLDAQEYISNKSKYKGYLTDYIPQDAKAYFGGQNLENQIKKFIDILSNGEGDSVLLYDSIIQNYIQKYFGENLNFQTDLLPFFANEYGFAISEVQGKDVYTMLIQLEKPKEDSVALAKIADTFSEVGGLFEPQIVEHILKDGTKSREIIAIPEEIKRETLSYENIQISAMKIGERNWGLYYAFLENVAVVSGNLETLKNIIDTTKSKNISLNKSEHFKKLIDPLLTYSDSIAYYSIDSLLPMLFEGGNGPQILEIISSVSSGKNYFNDGIATVNYLTIK